MSDLVERMRGLEGDHTPDSWPAVRMRDISGLCDEITALRAELADAKKDAERYAFAKSRAYVGISHTKECLWVLFGIHEVRYDAAKIHGFDAAIDNAIAGEKK